MKNELKAIDNKTSQVVKPIKKDIFLFRTSLAGTSHKELYYNAWDLMPEVPLILQRDMSNKSDKYAISVFTEDHKLLGYIPRKDNKILSRLMDAGKYLYAKEYVALNENFYWEIEIEVYMLDY